MAATPASPVITGNARGTDGTDWMIGDNKINWIDAGKGDDFVFGNVGFDSLHGEEGNDYLNGGEGDDFLAGGPGADVFASEWFEKPGPILYFLNGEHPPVDADQAAWDQYTQAAKAAGYFRSEPVLDDKSDLTGHSKFYKEGDHTYSSDAHNDTITDFHYDFANPVDPANDRIELYGIPEDDLPKFLETQVIASNNEDKQLTLSFHDETGHIFGTMTFAGLTYDATKPYGDWFL